MNYLKKKEEEFKQNKDYKIYGKDIYGAYYLKKNILLDHNSIIYDIGVGEDITFIQSLIDNFDLKKVYLFDPGDRPKEYIKTLTDNNNLLKEKLVFHKYGCYTDDTNLKFYKPRNEGWVSQSIISNAPYVNSKEYDLIEVKKITTIMNELNHNNIDILKIDAGGSECEIVLQLLESTIKPKSICILHNNHIYGDKKVNNFIRKMNEKGYEEYRNIPNRHKITYTLK